METWKYPGSKVPWKWCPKCGMKAIPVKGTDVGDMCWLCFSKLRKNWPECKWLILHGIAGEGWHYSKPPIKPDGWEWLGKLDIVALMCAVCCCGSLNKTPKVPEWMTGLHEFGKTCVAFGYPKFWVNKWLTEKHHVPAI